MMVLIGSHTFRKRIPMGLQACMVHFFCYYLPTRSSTPQKLRIEQAPLTFPNGSKAHFSRNIYSIVRSKYDLH